VLHWIRTLGPENVLIVDSQDLKDRHSATVQSVFAFLGLCPAELSSTEPEVENVTNTKQKIPAELAWTAASFAEVQSFYAPFNQQLYALIGRDLGWEHSKFKPANTTTTLKSAAV
jgi:hypothetical protein